MPFFLDWLFFFVYFANFIHYILVYALVVVFSLYNAVLPNHPNTLYGLSMVCIHILQNSILKKNKRLFYYGKVLFDIK